MIRSVNLILSLVIGSLLLSSFALTVQAASPTSPAEVQAASGSSLQPSGEPVTGIHLTLSPVFINITTNPGLDVSSDFKVTNNSNVKENLQLSLIRFRADQNGGNIVPIDIDKSDEFASWITFSENQFSIDPNETKTIKFKISPPKTAALGYYYGIRVGRLRERQSTRTEAIITGSAVLSLLMEVRSPNAQKVLNIVDFNTSSPFYEYLPTQFSIKIKNAGNIHLVPFGDIFIDQGGRKEIGVAKVNEGRSNILPGTERTIVSEWKEGFPLRVPKMNGETTLTDKKNKPIYTTQWDFNKIANFRIGKYTANLVMVYNDGKQDVPLNASLSFWVIPWKILLGVLVIISLVFFGLKSIFTSIFRRH